MPLMKGVEVHPLNDGGGVSKATCSAVFRGPYPSQVIRADIPRQKLRAGPRNLEKQAFGCGHP